MARPSRDALYDRDSITWRMNSSWFVLIGGPRAAILQVCDPGVAAGVASYSTFRTDTVGRLERTLDAMLAISFGSPERREKVLAGLERAHANVAGTLEDGTSYTAMEPERQYWVLATLTDTVIEVDRRYLGRMGRADRERYFEESKLMADAFGVLRDVVPEDYDAFRDYMAEMFATLQPTEESREVTRALMAPRVPYVPAPAWLPFNLITKDLLPRRMRHELGLGDLNPVESAAVRSAAAAMRAAVPLLPTALTLNPIGSRALAADAA